MSEDLERLQAALPRRYTLLRELDRGGLSRVYLAKEELPEREVVIKVLAEELSARLGEQNFVFHVEAASRLQHPHVLPVFAAGEAGGALYYVTPYLKDRSLRDRLETEGRPTVTDALRITRQVGDALSHAHAQDIVHQDVKPTNILFQSGHAVVADFGIARAVLAADRRRIGRDGEAMADWSEYASPEVVDGTRPVDARADVFSLAAVLYEMLAGHPPYRGTSSRAGAGESPPESARTLRRTGAAVGPALESVLGRGLSAAPADRFGSVDAFMAALDEATSESVAGAPTVASSGRAASKSNRLPRWLAGVALAAIVLIGGLFVVSTGTVDDPYQVSVAVMPFENRTGDSAFENLGRSVTEELVHLLTTVPELRVIDPYTAASLMRDSLGTPALLDTLAVDHLIHGYIEARDGELIVNVSESDLGGFLSARTQHRIDPDQIGTGQVQLANVVARSFLADLGLEDRFDPGGTVIGPGRNAYLAGNEALGQRTPAAMREAIARFRQATTLEPESAPALSALSSAFALTLYYKYDVGLPAYELAARALAAADSAIAVDPDVANGYSARGYARALLGMEIDGAAADFARAEELAPNAPNGPSWSARILARQGRIDDAFAEAGRARDLDPLQAGRRTALASLGFQLGRYDVTIEESREAYRLEPRLLLAKAFEARALALTGRGGACARLELGVYELVHTLCLVDAGAAAEAAGRAEEAARRLETGNFEPGEYLPEVVAQDLASYYGFTGNALEAARWLRFAFDRSPAGVDERILGSALFAPVTDDPGFAAAVSEVQAAAIERVLRTRAGLRPPL